MESGLGGGENRKDINKARLLNIVQGEIELGKNPLGTWVDTEAKRLGFNAEEAASILSGKYDRVKGKYFIKEEPETPGTVLPESKIPLILKKPSKVVNPDFQKSVQTTKRNSDGKPINSED